MNVHNDDDDDDDDNNIFQKDHIAYVQIVFAQDLFGSDAIFMIADL
jgi:hypothetical protein